MIDFKGSQFEQGIILWGVRWVLSSYQDGSVISAWTPTHSLYDRHRFPMEIISHCVWLYFRFCLSFRDIEEMMAKRGVVVSYEFVREWCLKFGGPRSNGCARAVRVPGTVGIWAKCISRLTANCIIYGVRLTRTGKCSTCWCSC